MGRPLSIGVNMVTKPKPSEAETETVLTPEEAPSEAPVETPAEVQVEPAPEEEKPTAPVQEVKEEKPDFREQIAALPQEERDALYQEQFGDRLVSERQSARDTARGEFEQAQRQQAKSNQELQQTVQNIDNENDPAKRSQAIQDYANNYARGWVEQRDGQWRTHTEDVLQRGFNLSEGEAKAAWLAVHQTAATENRVADPSDFIKHLTGERFMPKTEATKAIREEVRALHAELQGQAIESQAETAPKTMGPGEPPSTKSVEQRWVEEGSPQTGPLADEYREWRTTLPPI